MSAMEIDQPDDQPSNWVYNPGDYPDDAEIAADLPITDHNTFEDASAEENF